ncbi:histidine phosphatase family protein [Minwuia sp.]|uniref:histidine phosphatase family protein n=1 Tax=Minwuia sp. TaxID=2493630 RepID=UPI003A931CE9
MVSALRRTAGVLAACLLALTLTQNVRADASGWQAAKADDAVLIMRHALAPGTGDPAAFRIGDCSTQRNLSQAGRDQARAIGAAFRDRGITFDRVLTSAWCRCEETAQLLEAGPVEVLPALNSFFGAREREAAQTRALQGFIAGLEPGERVLMVTHQVNISALTGEFTRSGEVLVLRPEDSGIAVSGRILIAP